MKQTFDRHMSTLKVKNDHRSKFSNLSNWKEEAWKNQGFNGIRTHDLRVTGALLYQLSYEATHWGARSIYWVHISREEWNDVKYTWNNSFLFIFFFFIFELQFKNELFHVYFTSHVNIAIAEPIRRCVRWRTQVFKIEGFVCKRFLPSPPPPPTFIFWLFFHFSRDQNRESRSSVFLCSETKLDYE